MIMCETRITKLPRMRKVNRGAHPEECLPHGVEGECGHVVVDGHLRLVLCQPSRDRRCGWGMMG